LGWRVPGADPPLSGRAGMARSEAAKEKKAKQGGARTGRGRDSGMGLLGHVPRKYASRTA
jgi:hypothetical protein